MLCEQIDPAAVHGHRRRVGQDDAAFGDQLEAPVLPLGVAAVGLEDHRHRRERIAVLVAELGAELEEQRESRAALRFGRAHYRVARGTSAQRVQPAGRVELTLQGGAIERELQIGGAEIVQHRDDAIPTEIGRIRHRRPPVALHAARVFVQERRMGDDHRPRGLDVVSPDGVDQPARQHQSRPVRQAVAPGQRELRIREPGRRRVGNGRVMLPERRDRRGLAAMDLAQQIFRLVSELIEVGADRNVTIGHDGPPSERCPESARSGERRFV